MKIQGKISIFIFLTIIVYVFISLSVQRFYWIPKLTQYVNDSARIDMKRCRDAIVREERHLAILARDYAVWSETYDYAINKNPNYITENLAPEAIKNAKLAFWAIYKDEIRITSKFFINDKVIDEWNGIPKKINGDDFFIGDIKDKKAKTGIIQTEFGPCIAASMAIFHSDLSGPSIGTIVMGKLLDNRLQKIMRETTNIDMNFYDLSKKEVSNKWQTIIAATKNRNNLMIIEDSPDVLSLFSLLKDIHSAPAVLVHLHTDRQVLVMGTELLQFASFSSLLLALVISLAVSIFLYFLIIKPLKILELAFGILSSLEKTNRKHVTKILKRKDEIGNLAKEFVEMQENIIESHEEVLKMNESLESKVNERTIELKVSNEQLQLIAKVMETTSEGVVITNEKARIVKMNDAFCRMAGYSFDELIGKNPRILKSGRHDKNFYIDMWTRLIKDGQWAGEIWDRKKNGEVYPKWLTINAIKNDIGTTTHYVGISSDISKIKKVEGQLQQMAYYDSLTNLPNRVLFYERLNRSLIRRKRYGYKTALMFLDLDRFKNINDTMGHAAGDALLVEVAKRINKRVRESDTVCRLGGDEFTIILDRINHNEDVAIISEEIIAAVSQPITIHQKEVSVGASIGIAISPEDDTTVDGLIRKADAAMYYAKELGRGRYSFATQEIEDRNQKYVDIETRLHHALERDEFILYFQPQISAEVTEKATPGTIIGAEALIRWKPKGEKMIFPDQFISIAEETGLILPIGKFILREACKSAKILVNKGHDIRIGVNISVKQFDDPNFINDVKEALIESDLDARYIQLELTETLLLKDIEKVIEILKKLKEVGVTIAIDDFGTGYSSLSYIGHLPIDYLKIDKGFVSKIAEDPTEKELVTTIISIANSFNLKTVAEGVENEYQMDFLCHNGCNELQGYLFSRPLNFQKFLDFLSYYSIRSFEFSQSYGFSELVI